MQPQETEGTLCKLLLIPWGNGDLTTTPQKAAAERASVSAYICFPPGLG